ncbi:unnamed protein product, partial [Allacma fusca]
MRTKLLFLVLLQEGQA